VEQDPRFEPNLRDLAEQIVEQIWNCSADTLISGGIADVLKVWASD
jgi:hypothetical protein